MISGSARFLLNLESLNGVESIGNLTKHRTAPVVLKTSNGYLVRYVPVISGEALAHAYQASLVDIAKNLELPVGKLSSNYEFIKFSNDDVLKLEDVISPSRHKNVRKFEVEVMLKDIVADVGGFMYAGSTPVRRTSRIKFGYMIPALRGDDIPAQLEAQFHVRFSNKPESGSQAIFNVEVSSALYTMSFELDDDLIAVPSTVGENVDEEEKKLEEEKPKRREAAIKALYAILTSNFGGKRTRFLPSSELKSLVVTKTNFPFIPEPAHNDNYIKLTGERLEKAKSIMNGKAEMYVINNENLEVSSNVTLVNTIEDLIEKLTKNQKN